MTITNETIIKAAKAAGIVVYEEDFDLVIPLPPSGEEFLFRPLINDADNALIRRGAEIDVGFWWQSKVHPASVEATAWVKQKNVDIQHIVIKVPSGNDKAQSEREAVILCAAAKWDAMQGEQK